MIVSSSHTGFVVRDMEKSISFYRDVLGLELTGMGENEGQEKHSKLLGFPRVHLKSAGFDIGDGHTLELLEYAHPRGREEVNDRNDLGAAHLAFFVTDIDEVRNGCHVLVEKPMANAVGDAITITKIAMGSGLHLVGGYQRHYENLYITAKSAIADGVIGNLQKFEAHLAQRWSAGGWRGDRRFSGGGQPNDSGSHLQDIFLWMTGSLPTQVYGNTDMKFEDEAGNLVPKSVEINSYSDVTLDNGAKGNITILGNTRVGFEEWVILEGDAGTIEIKGNIRFIPKNGGVEPLAYERPEGYPNSKVDQLVGLVKGDYDVNYTSGINGVRTSWLTNSILEAGKGPDERNLVNCDQILEREGYNRQFVLALIDECASMGMF